MKLPLPPRRYPHLGVCGAVRGSQRPDLGAGGVLRVLAQRGGRPHPARDRRHHGGLDHEHLLGDGHGHPGKSVRLCLSWSAICLCSVCVCV